MLLWGQVFHTIMKSQNFRSLLSKKQDYQRKVIEKCSNKYTITTKSYRKFICFYRWSFGGNEESGQLSVYEVWFE